MKISGAVFVAKHTASPTDEDPTRLGLSIITF